jgi:hypothetical protein
LLPEDFSDSLQAQFGFGDFGN